MKKFTMMVMASFTLLAFAELGHTAPVYLNEQHTYGNIPIGAPGTTNALGAPDTLYMPISGNLTTYADLISYKFSDNVQITAGGADITLREIGQDSLALDPQGRPGPLASVNMWVSQTGLFGEWYSLGQIQVEDALYTNSFTDGTYTYYYADKEVDLDVTGLSWIRYVLFQGVNTSGTIAGFDLDAVTGQAVPIPGAVWLLGSGLLGMIAIRRKRNN